MKPIAFDTETYPFGPFKMAPPPVCLSIAVPEVEDETCSTLFVSEDMAKIFELMLDKAIAGTHVIVGHNTAYDMAVMMNANKRLVPKVFKAYDLGRVHCTQTREKLIAIHEGGLRWDFSAGKPVKRKWALAELAKKRLNRELDKDDAIRLNYGNLEGIPLEQWSKGQREYPVEDSKATLDVWAHQEKHDGDKLHDAEAQARSAFALHLVGCWGMRTHKERVVALHGYITGKMRRLEEELKDAEIIRRGKGTKDTKKIRRLVEETYAGKKKLPKTPTGATKTSKEVLEMCKHPALQLLVEYNALQKTKSTYGEVLLQGIYRPIHAYFDSLGANSGRTSCRGPNLQNQPRLPGVRECFIPSREDWCFVTADYDALELRTLAQACLDLLGKSALAERFREDPDFDPHCHFAAQLMGITYEEALAGKKTDKTIKDRRQQSKAANFGFPGGMGAESFMDYAKGYGVILTLDEAQALRDRWFEQWPEMADYFRKINNVINGPANCGDVRQLYSGRIRGMCGYTDAANTFFQGLAADGAKLALYVVVRETFNPKSPLYGFHVVNFIHDEIMMEGPRERAHEAGLELVRIMQTAMEKVTPDVPSRASATAMEYWSKDAEAVYENGRLVPWCGDTSRLYVDEDAENDDEELKPRVANPPLLQRGKLYRYGKTKTVGVIGICSSYDDTVPIWHHAYTVEVIETGEKFDQYEHALMPKVDPKPLKRKYEGTGKSL